MKLKDIFKLERKHIFIYIGLALSIFIYSLVYILGLLFRAGILKDNLVPPEYLSDFVWILPGPMITDILLLYLLPVVGLLIFLKFAPSLIRAYISIHKLSYIGRKTPQYGIVEVGPKRSIWMLLKRTLLISFLSFTISAYIVNIGFDAASLFRSNIKTFPDAYPLNIAEAMFLGTFFFMPIALLIVLPIWLLEDSGIIFYRRFPDDVIKTPTMRGTHNLFEQILEGFTGISTIIMLYNITIRCFNVLQPGSPAILTPIILIFLPLFVAGVISFALVIYEKLLPETVKKVHDRLIRSNYFIIEAPPALENIKRGTHM